MVTNSGLTSAVCLHGMLLYIEPVKPACSTYLKCDVVLELCNEVDHGRHEEVELMEHWTKL